jgi:[ribosomal protein S5]-alanine N-acetyltransferase
MTFLWDNIFPVLETKRLILREIHVGDRDAMFAVFSDPVLMKYYNMQPIVSMEQAEEILHRLKDNFYKQTQIRWAIVEKESDSFIGTCGFHAIDQKHDKAEIGYELDSTAHGMGYMAEAVNEIIRFGFEELFLNRIEAFYHPHNIASHNVLSRAGFAVEGVLRQRYKMNDVYVDMNIASILREKQQVEA